MKRTKVQKKASGKKTAGIHKQLSRVFGLLIGFLIIVEILTMVVMFQLKNTYEELLEYKNNTTEQLQQIKTDSSTMTGSMLMLVNTNFYRDIQKQETLIDEMMSSLEEQITVYIDYVKGNTVGAKVNEKLRSKKIPVMKDTLQKMSNLKASIFKGVNEDSYAIIESTYLQYQSFQNKFNSNTQTSHIIFSYAL